MKNFLFISILLLSFQAKCDTTDFYHVYWNDSLIAKFNSVSIDKTITLKVSEIKSGDVISVRYGSDHPCINCRATVAVLVEIEDSEGELTEESAPGDFEKISIPLYDLLFYERNYGYDKFKFQYSLQSIQPDRKVTSFLFELKLE